jgi:hypothetical protein
VRCKALPTDLPSPSASQCRRPALPRLRRAAPPGTLWQAGADPHCPVRGSDSTARRDPRVRSFSNSDAPRAAPSLLPGPQAPRTTPSAEPCVVHAVRRQLTRVRALVTVARACVRGMPHACAQNVPGEGEAEEGLVTSE